MRLQRLPAKIGSVVANLLGILLVVALVVQVAPGGTFARLLATFPSDGFPDGPPLTGPID